MRLALTGCSWCYDNGFVFKLYEIGVGAGSCSNASVHFRRRLRCKPSRLKRAGELYEISSEGRCWRLAMSSWSNSSVQLQKEDIEHLRCKLSRLKRAGELYETGSDWMRWVLCDNGFVFKQLCSAM